MSRRRSIRQQQQRSQAERDAASRRFESYVEGEDRRLAEDFAGVWDAMSPEQIQERAAAVFAREAGHGGPR